MLETTNSFQTDFERLTFKILLLMSGDDYDIVAPYTSLLLSAVGALFAAFDVAQTQALPLIG
jgi:hypothetical protein